MTADAAALWPLLSQNFEPKSIRTIARLRGFPSRRPTTLLRKYEKPIYQTLTLSPIGPWESGKIKNKICFYYIFEMQCYNIVITRHGEILRCSVITLL
jgi:hypothetical protein